MPDSIDAIFFDTGAIQITSRRESGMSKRWIGLLITTFLSFGFFGAGIADATEEPAADEVWLFGSEHCADCTAFRQWWADHPGQVAGLKLVILQIDGVMNFKRFLALEKKWERKAGSTFPVIAFRRDFVFGEGIVDRFIDRLTSPSIVESQYLVVDSARIASINEQDPGNIYVYIRNTSSVPFQFKEIRLNEKPIPVWGVDLNILSDSDKKTDKATRIEANLEPLNREGRLIFNEAEKENPHMKRLVEQFLLFSLQLKFPADGPDCIEGAKRWYEKKLQQLRPAVIGAPSIRQSLNKHRI